MTAFTQLRTFLQNAIPSVMQTQPHANLVELSFIRRRVQDLAQQIGAPRSIVTFGESRHDGSPHIEVGKAYAFIVCERGIELERRSTTDIDELLFWVFEVITVSMASDYELKNRKKGEDSRRQWFAKQVELLALLSPEWASRETSRHNQILEEHPFNDRIG